MALLAGLDHDALPTLQGIALATFLAVAGHDRQEVVYAKLSGLLHQQIHLLALEQTLSQGQRSRITLLFATTLDDLGGDQVFVRGAQDGGEHRALAVKKFHRLPGPQAQHRGHVSGLGATNFDVIGGQDVWIKVKTSHGSSLA